MSDPTRDWSAHWRAQHGAALETLSLLDADELSLHALAREALVARLGARALVGCGHTKLDMHGLSPGCRACVAGTWSCLFVNSHCDAGCRWCPSPQDRVGQPTTQGIAFPEPREYAAFVTGLGFTGVSLSGGEPLLTPERTLSFLRVLRARCRPDLHLWVYTSGLHLGAPEAQALARAGVDEIRVDLGASGWRLEPLRHAVAAGVRVTVEVPAPPDEEDRLLALLPELRRAGVSHLNLHQLRLTAHNLPRLRARGYRFAVGPEITVAGSDLVALRLLERALDEVPDLPVNYCSAVYKRRHQAAGLQRRLAEHIRRPEEVVTEVGLLRTVHQEEGRPVRASWRRPRLRPSVSYRCPFERVHLGRDLVIEKEPVLLSHPLSPAEVAWLQGGPAEGLSPELLACERIPEGWMG